MVTVATTDPLGRVVRVVKSAADKDIRIVRTLGSTPIVTEFSYAPTGELIQTRDPNLNESNYTYDSLGRPYWFEDSGYATGNYWYDDLDRLMEYVDTREQSTLYTHDALGRVLTRTTAAGLPHEQVTTNTYDEARPGFHNVGQLTTAANDNAVIAYDYDAGGRKVQEAVTVDGSSYVTVSAFDAGGRLTSRVYPDSTSSGTFGYNSAGQQVTLGGAITATTYTAAGAGQDRHLRQRRHHDLYVLGDAGVAR